MRTHERARTSGVRTAAGTDRRTDGRQSAFDADFALPPVHTGAPIDELRKTAATCRACPLWERGTQTVFGDGPDAARLVLVGEQPGHEEDIAGVPFVGPAGRLLRRALVDAGVDAADAYVTNAVKHFKWVEKGKKRIHSKPSAREVRACKPWLVAEIDAIEPAVIVALGATASQTLLGASFKVTQHLGDEIEMPSGHVVVPALHPLAILRARDEKTRRAQYDGLVRVLRSACERSREL